MSLGLDLKRWAIRAQEVKFGQLDIARKQAETWRTGLATLTTLLTGVLVVKGRDDASTLTRPYQVVVAVLLGLALILLLWATMWISRALAGSPVLFLLSGETLEKWTDGEVRKISKALSWAPRLAAASVLAVAAAVAFTWFAPAQATSTSHLVKVTESTGHQSCGQLIGVSNYQLIVAPTTGPTLIPLSAVAAITPVTACP